MKESEGDGRKKGVRALDSMTEGRYGLKLPEIRPYHTQFPGQFFNDLLDENGYSRAPEFIKDKNYINVPGHLEGYKHEIVLQGDEEKDLIVLRSKMDLGPQGITSDDILASEYIGRETHEVLILPEDKTTLSYEQILFVESKVSFGKISPTDSEVKIKGEQVVFSDETKTAYQQSVRKALRDFKDSVS